LELGTVQEDRRLETDPPDTSRGAFGNRPGLLDTVEADADGNILFWKDVYTWDTAMLKALDRRSRLRIVHERPLPKAVTPTPPEEQEAVEPPMEKSAITLFNLFPLDVTPGEGPLDVH